MTSPSPQQQAVIDWVRTGTGSGFVEAVAGAGKTTTLIKALAETRGYVSFMAFNKKIADEIKFKIARLEKDGIVHFGNRVRVGTCHSFGFSAWRRYNPEVRVAEGHEKTDMMIEKFQIEKSLRTFVPKLISLAKQSACGLYWQVDDDAHWYEIIDRHDLADDIETDDPKLSDELLRKGIKLAQEGIRWHREVGGEILDFDDMIWLPVVSGTKFFNVDWVFGDEWQDTNPLRRALARKMLKFNGRACFVGDRHQAIYGFTGADNDAVDQVIREFKCTLLPLTVTFRCPKEVVREAQTVVDHIIAHDTAPEGAVNSVIEADFWKQVDQLTPTDAILCRNTKPLVATAYAMIKRGIACHVEGRDIGMGLLKLVNRFDTNDIEAMIDRLQAYAAKQCEKLKAKGRETQAEALMDRVETVIVLAEGCRDVDCVRTKIMTMFQDSEHERRPTLTLSTVHKSKGREWERVFILGRNLYMPSKYARQAWQIQQEDNLLYVCITRAMNELIYVELEPK
jgi:DNA helicase-2/ATP-dependent DNA helicase PcrA